MRTKRYQKIFAFVFLIAVVAFAVVNVVAERGGLSEDIKEIGMPDSVDALQSLPGEIDAVLTENLVGGYGWNELYGAVHKFLGKNEENNFKYVRDKNGFLYSADFWNSSNVHGKKLALRVRRLQDAVADSGTKVVCIACPSKYSEELTDGYYGIPYSDYNEHVDEVLLYMRRYNVNYLDYRECLLETDKTQEDIYYKTDHHWTTETAFWATGVLLEYLETNFGEVLDPDGYYRDINNYVVETYEDIYMGSQGRETGMIYAGTDDYTYIYPKFEAEYTYEYTYLDGQIGVKTGDTLDTLIDKKYLTYKNEYDREMYNSYLGGVRKSDKIVNEMNPDGPKILYIRDSYFSPVAAFMAPMCSEMDLIWALYYDQAEVEHMIVEGDYDYIFVALANENFVDEGFPFRKE